MRLSCRTEGTVTATAVRNKKSAARPAKKAMPIHLIQRARRGLRSLNASQRSSTGRNFALSS